MREHGAVPAARDGAFDGSLPRSFLKPALHIACGRHSAVLTHVHDLKSVAGDDGS